MSKSLSRMDFILHHQGVKSGQLDELDQKAVEGLEYLDRGEDIAGALKRIDQRVTPMLKTDQPGRVRFVTMRRVVRVAAVFLGLVAAIFLLTRPHASDRLYDQYFTLAPNPYYQITRSAAPSAEDEFVRAFSTYELGQLDRAEYLLGQLITAYPEKQDLPFYLSVVLMANDKMDQAIPLLEKSKSSSYQDIGDRAVWYLALANLKTGDRKQAMELLQFIVDQDLPNRSDAEELIKALR